MRVDSVVFHKSYYEASIDLKIEEKIAFYTAIFDYAFYGIEPEIEGIVKSLFLISKHSVDSSIKSYTDGKKGGRPRKEKGGFKRGVKTTPETNKTNTKTNTNNKYTKENFPNLNIKAFNHWCDYKGKNYSMQGKTLSANKLSKFTPKEQQQMVDNSIMNNYKGLFEVKQQKSSKTKEPEVGSIAWRMKQEQEVIDVSDQTC